MATDLVTASTADTAIWIELAGAERHLMASVRGGAARKVLTFPQDGQEITSLALSADGTRAVYVLGGNHGANWAGKEPANTLSLPLPQPIAIHLVSLETGRDREVALGDYPVITPDGQRIAYLSGGAVWSLDLGDDAPRKIIAARGAISDLRWSPDGTRLAFRVDRGVHALIGVYEGEGRPLRWIAPALARDSRPAWSPDGRKLAYIRQRARGGTPRADEVPGRYPWQIWIADLDAGRARACWNSGDAPRDSVMWGAPLNWAGNDELVFSSYADGWQHLYALTSACGAPRLLTPLEAMVEDAAVSPDGTRIVFNANAGSTPGDAQRRHLYSVELAGGTPRALTCGTGQEWSPAFTGAGRLLALASDFDTAPGPIEIESAGTLRSLGGPERTMSGFVEPVGVHFTARDGVNVEGQLFRPAGKGPHPAIVFLHGGPDRQMRLGWHPMPYYARDYALNQRLAQAGFAVLSVNYRLGPGYGFAFDNPADAGSRGASEYCDVKAAGAFLARLDGIVPDRIGIYGGSYGGYLAALALGRDSSLFKAGVVIHGVSDWSSNAYFDEGVRDGYEQVPGQEAARRLAWQSSPVAHLARWTSPVLLIQGDDDRNVPVEQTAGLAARLHERGVAHETLLLVGETHDFANAASAQQVGEAVLDFFERRLMETKP